MSFSYLLRDSALRSRLERVVPALLDCTWRLDGFLCWAVAHWGRVNVFPKKCRAVLDSDLYSSRVGNREILGSSTILRHFRLSLESDWISRRRAAISKRDLADTPQIRKADGSANLHDSVHSNIWSFHFLRDRRGGG